MAGGEACVECAAVEPHAQPDVRPARYGPFHRLASPTQTEEDARRQSASGEIWGRTPQSSDWVQVRAYRGSLPNGLFGIEFYTDILPDDPQNRSRICWSSIGGRVRLDGEFAKLECVVTKIRYPAELQ